MYFQIENTPEHIRKARRVNKALKESPKEECPRLILAPFCKPPQVLFENVLIGSTCEKTLEVLNPSKQLQNITLGKALPPDLTIHLPGEWLEVEPETCYTLNMSWRPMQPMAVRETIRFTNEDRGRYDVIVVLKSAMNIKGKKNQPKSFKTSPGKRKKPVSKKSPVAIYKKKSQIIYNSTTVQKTVIQSTVQSTQQNFDYENLRNDYSIDSNQNKCPFDSPTSQDWNFNTSEVFMKKKNVLPETYDKSCEVMDENLNMPHNILRSSNKQNSDNSITDILDKLTFTPLKSVPDRTDKSKINLSVEDSQFNDPFDFKTSNKENQPYSIMTIHTSQPPNKWLTFNETQIENYTETTPSIPNKKQPSTSSPKDFNSPNFSMNTDFSRISDMSFFPPRHSTERKHIPKINETHEIIDEAMGSDTFTKDSPNPIVTVEKPPHYFDRDQPKMCRQSLFREYQMQREAFDKNFINNVHQNVWQNELRVDTKSPPRPVTPPLQSIPEESIQFSDTQVFAETMDQMATFTLDRTYDKTDDRSSMSRSIQSWSKKAIGAEPVLWKVPVANVRKSIKPKAATKLKDSSGSKFNVTIESNKSHIQNITINQIGNIYSQSSTVDPFSSATYFYDEEAVHKFENECKRWLNCVLTPPADLDSNVEQKIDVGKAWLDNRNKEVPLAPTKEQVSSAYHNSHRLESVRRSARKLLRSSEIVTVFQKLSAQIEKKLITIRTDRNLHLDVSLQKTILEILLSYNPLWLRIGLESIYGVVLPLKSNSDIEGLTKFIIQRMFKNPFLKNKHSKSSTSNMLLPAYMEAIKKFTLKKFFMLVYLLDQAKERKLISHDPCLFHRNAVCKESREIIIRFTRELIAGIGDITKHLRPVGYVVCQKQSYLDEYKYAVHNLAVDIRDGVRLTKVMEIIVMKNGLSKQLRTPAISRLQKIHNVQVAINALKEANFAITGEITAADIADGHREKTLSLLWQIIHEFRAPLFEKAANVIQTWWRKKYEVIVEKRTLEERTRMRLTNAANIIQHWWRKTQYNRQVEWRMQQITKSTIVFQKYCRMWLCRTRLNRLKRSVIKIEEWYKSTKLMRESKHTLARLILEREQLKYRSATFIQSHVRRWLCVKRYKSYIKQRNAAIVLQNRYRALRLMRKERNAYLVLKKAALCVQRRYRAQIEMCSCRDYYIRLKTTSILIQRRYRALKTMVEQRSRFTKLKSACIKIQNGYRAYILGKLQKENYLRRREAVVKIQHWYRSCRKGRRIKQVYEQTKQASVTIQRYYKAYIIGRRVRQEFTRIKTATIRIQKFYRSYREMKTVRREYIRIKTSTVIIQKYYRTYVETKKQRTAFLTMKDAVSCIETFYRRYKECQAIRQRYLQLRRTAIFGQRIYRSIHAMRKQREEFVRLKQATIALQRKYRALRSMRVERQSYLKLRTAIVTIQTRYKAQRLMKLERLKYLAIRKACISIHKYYRARIVGRTIRQEYLKLKESTIVIQRRYRALLDMRKERNSYIAKKSAAIVIQRRYRAHHLMLKNRHEYLTTLKACKTIQSFYRAYVYRKIQRAEYLKVKTAIVFIQQRFRMWIESKKIRKEYLHLKYKVILIQRRFRANRLARSIRQNNAAKKIQSWYKSISMRDSCRKEYLLIRKSVIKIQSTIRMYLLRKRYLTIKTSTWTIQRHYRSYKLTILERKRYIYVRMCIIKLQSYVRRYIASKRFLRLRAAACTIQSAYRLKKHRDLIREQRGAAAVILQKNIRRYLVQSWYRQYRKKVCFMQRVWRGKLLTRYIQCEYLQKRRIIIQIQSIARGYLARKRLQFQKEEILKIREEKRLYRAAAIIQALFRGNKVRAAVQDERIPKIRKRWREGALQSKQLMMRERNEEALFVLAKLTGIDEAIKACESLELLTEVFPMMYKHNAQLVARHILGCMSLMNRSISCIEVLLSSAAILVNLTRFKGTGPQIYSRKRISSILVYMSRFTKTETELFCRLCTHLWLFSKYNAVKEDLTVFLQQPDNRKMLMSIKTNIESSQRRTNNSRNKPINNKVKNCLYHSNISMNTTSSGGNTSFIMPSLEPDYGIIKIDRPRYFDDTKIAIDCIFKIYNL